tara:strand:- start:2413 stop:2919 length:507 start_codon:yes stop_codon:yes gene_type:complete
MFTFYKKHKNELYNKLVQLSRNNFFYRSTNLNDNFETRALLVLFHLAIILKSKKKEKSKKAFQELFDNIFKNIEFNIRELGYGDTSVNKNMKTLSKIFYDVLFQLDKVHSFSFNTNTYLLEKYFYKNKKINIQKTKELALYFDEFQNFCFDLDVNNVLKGLIDFKYSK